MPVYFIEAIGSDAVKIGHAIDVSRRFNTMRCHCPLDLRILRTLPGAREEEKWLHEHFRTRRVRGEWFLFCPEMLTISVPEQAEIIKYSAKLRAGPSKVVINKFGGIAPAARALGLPQSTVQGWRISGYIPGYRQSNVLAKAKELGLDVTPADFFDRPASVDAPSPPEAI